MVEDLTQSPSAMSTLKVLQNCPTQKKALLLAIECVDPSNSNLIVFSHENYTPLPLTQLAFIIWFVIHGKKIHCSIVDEGASTCIMSMS